MRRNPSTFLSRGSLLATTIAALALATPAGAQRAAATPPGIDSVYRRAQRLANEGNTPDGRALLDSLLAATPQSSATYIETLFRRAGLAGSADESQRDYLRILVDFPNAPRAEDALLRLAQMEIARGDRAAARRHLERLAQDYPLGASRGQGAYWLGRVLLEEGAMAGACAALDSARAHTAESEVELGNQITYYSRPCSAIRQAALDSIRADSVAKAEAARRDSVDAAQKAARARRAQTQTKSATAKGEAPTKGDASTKGDTPTKEEVPTKSAASKKSDAPPKSTPLPKSEPPEKKSAPRSAPARNAPGTQWTVQVAAYANFEEAQKLATRLTSRGLDVRVTSERPFRVRIGRFDKRADAIDLAAKLKTENTDAIVVEAERP